MSASLILDGVVAGLLAAFIGYAMVLNRKLGEMRKAKAEMEVMVRQFAEATAQAQRGLADLKIATGMSGDTLQKRLGEAKVLSQDLSFLVEKGSGLADRLETQIAAGRSRPTASAQPPREKETGRPLGVDIGAPEAGLRSPRLRPVQRSAEHPATEEALGAQAADKNDASGQGKTVGASPRGSAKLMHALRAMR